MSKFKKKKIGEEKISPMGKKGMAPLKRKTNMDYGKLPTMKTKGMPTETAMDTTAINLGEEGMFTESGAFNAGLVMGRKHKANAGTRASNRADRQNKRGDRQAARTKKKEARKTKKANKNLKF